MRTVIIEDEPKSRELLRALIAEYSPDLEIVGEAGSVKKGLPLVQELRPDLLLLDINLDDGLSFEIIDEIDYATQIIFISAHRHYAQEAIQYGALDYLTKPLNHNDFIAAVNKAKDFLSKESDSSKDIHFSMDKFVLPTILGYKIVALADITHLVAQGGKTRVYHSDGSEYDLRKSLNDMDQILQKSGFIRVHYSYCVNLRAIDEIQIKDSQLKLNNATQIPFSRRRKGLLFQELNRTMISAISEDDLK